MALSSRPRVVTTRQVVDELLQMLKMCKGKVAKNLMIELQAECEDVSESSFPGKAAGKFS